MDESIWQLMGIRFNLLIYIFSILWGNIHWPYVFSVDPDQTPRFVKSD